jgi:hypothetical protein
MSKLTKFNDLAIADSQNVKGGFGWLSNSCAPKPSYNTCAPAPSYNTCAPAPSYNTCAPAPSYNTCAPVLPKISFSFSFGFGGCR